jgi:catechol 2,3-dioxygenase-like lactoylglutathione lyase family enzyme
MPDHFELLRLSHVNAIVDGYDRTVAHCTDNLGMQMNMPIPARDGDDTDACLMSLGDVIFEFFAPRHRAERGQGRLLDLYGDHYIGVEFQVPDVDAARDLCASRGIRIIRDHPGVIFTHPGACCGISWELFFGDFHTPPHGGRAGDEVTNELWTAVHGAAYWRDEHPFGVTGLRRLTVAVRDLDAALDTFVSITGGTIIDRPDRPGTNAVDLQVGDTVFELLAPTADGELGDWLTRYGDRLRSTVFEVADLGRVEKALADKGIELVPGDAAGTMAIRPEQNCNLRFEFTE